jgi:hypothetical protein
MEMDKERNNMKSVDIEEAKREAKERMSKSIDAYFERFADIKKDRLPNIDEIEAMWGEGQKDILGILSSVTGNLAGVKTRTVKKTAGDATGK